MQKHLSIWKRKKKIGDMRVTSSYQWWDLAEKKLHKFCPGSGTSFFIRQWYSFFGKRELNLVLHEPWFGLLDQSSLFIIFCDCIGVGITELSSFYCHFLLVQIWKFRNNFRIQTITWVFTAWLDISLTM